MSGVINLQMAQRGVLTLPKELRDAYDLEAGDDFTLIDLGGVFVLRPRRTEVDLLADRVREAFEARGETMETVLDRLRAIREEGG